MASDPSDHPENLPEPTVPAGEGLYTQEVRHSHIGARVPEKVARGAFSTGALVGHGAHEFVIDFVARITQPHQIVARVVLPTSVMGRFIAALRENLNHYQAKFGAPPSLPLPNPPPTPPSVEEIYNQLKLSDEILSGTYANTVLIVHSPAEFCLDFITNFYPRPAVSCRIYLAAAHIPGLLQTLNSSFQVYQQKQGGQQPPSPPAQSG